MLGSLFFVMSLCRYIDITIFRYSGNSKVKEHFIVKMFGR